MSLSGAFYLSIFVLLLTACGTDGTTGGPPDFVNDGDSADDGDAPDGDLSDGDLSDGDLADGDVADGDMPDGDAADGDVPDGDESDGDAPDGDAPDGDENDGDAPDGDVSDGDTTDGDVPDGDTTDGDVADGDDDQSGFHPAGWANPAQHGAAFKLGESDCRNCHGQNLDGGARSCDSCHSSGWRNDCAFCHGGADNQTGAPPVDLRGRTARDETTVGAHTTHVTAAGHLAYDCSQCHAKPDDVLSPGHTLDATPGQAELVFAAGLSPQGVFNGDAACSSLYCHGDGRTAGASPAFTGTIDSCSTCHPFMSSTSDAWATMSGDHRKHLREGIACHECHGPVLNDDETIKAPELHVNGQKNVLLPSGGVWNGSNCTVVCHGETHFAQGW